MQPTNRLTTIFSFIDDKSIAVISKLFGSCNERADLKQMAKQLLLLDILNDKLGCTANRCLWDDQDVLRCLWIDIVKRHHQVVFVDSVHRNFTAHNAGKDRGTGLSEDALWIVNRTSIFGLQSD